MRRIAAAALAFLLYLPAPAAAQFGGGFLPAYAKISGGTGTTNALPKWDATGNTLTDSLLTDDGSNVIEQRNGANAQTFRLYNTYTDANNYERLSLEWAANIGFLETSAAGTGTLRGLRINGATVTLLSAGTQRWQIDGSGHLVAITDNTYDIGAATATRPKSIHVAAPALTSGSGTGLTVNIASELRRVVHKVTVTYAALAAAATTADKTIATLPAKTRLVGVLADTTTPYTGGGVTAATLIAGKTVGGNEYLVSHDVFSAAIVVGDADADLGTSINRANAIQGGDLASWTGTTAVSVRLTTTTANTDQLTAGSTTYYLTTESMP